jgi:superoxide dismutase, Fe-Mn family
VSVAVSIGTVARHRDVDTFLRNVDWRAVEGRYEDASKVAPSRPLVQEEFGDVPGVGVEEMRRCW